MIIIMSNEQITIDPHHTNHKETIYLTKDNSAWLTIEHLPDHLKKYGSDQFTNIFDLHPLEKGKVKTFNKNDLLPEWIETNCRRWSQSYLNTPKWTPDVMKSYMFSPMDDSINDKLPVEVLPFYEYMTGADSRYNQVNDTLTFFLCVVR